MKVYVHHEAKKTIYASCCFKMGILKKFRLLATKGIGIT